jgi:hypothetical protein
LKARANRLAWTITHCSAGAGSIKQGMDDGEKKKGNPDRKRERHAICTTAWLGSLVGELHCSSLMSVRANQSKGCMHASLTIPPAAPQTLPTRQSDSDAAATATCSVWVDVKEL